MDFIDLKSQQLRIRDRIDARFKKILDSGTYIMGPEIEELETQLRDYTGSRECLTCSNGTDALLIPLMALGVGPGDGVLVPAFTFFATAEVVSLVGATPIFVDVDPQTFVVSVATLEAALTDAKCRYPGMTIKGMIPVSLFGLCPDFDELLNFAERYGLFVIEDAAQSFGATFKGRRSCNLAPISATSFFPAKPLGCYGDGGAIFCESRELADVMRSIRVHGQGVDKYRNVRIGMNGRLDTLQAAVLLEKLSIFDDEVEKRQHVARRYTDGLADVAITPSVPDTHLSVWAQYTLRISDRDAVLSHLKTKDIPAVVYYAKPLHLQEAYAHLGYKRGELPCSEQLSGEVVSLPMHPYLSIADQDRIIEAVREALR